MKKRSIVVLAISLGIILMACGGKKESASSIAQKWCDLNAKSYKAAEGPEKEAAELAQEKFEDEMEVKYKDNEKFMDEVKKEVEKCEDSSEGR